MRLRGIAKALGKCWSRAPHPSVLFNLVLQKTVKITYKQQALCCWGQCVLGATLEQRLRGNQAPVVPSDAGRKQLGLLNIYIYIHTHI